LASAATEVFGRQGYRGTRTADVATAAGMSSGSVFTYVESKEALFHLVFAHGFGLFDDALPTLPLSTPAARETVELIAQNLRKVPVPRLRAALEDVYPKDARSELEGIVEERYDMITGLWPLLAVIERSASDLPELEAYYFGRLRVRYFAQLARYIETRSEAGYFRPIKDPTLTARLINESVSWFAWKRHEGRDAHLYGEAEVRSNLVEFITAALLQKPRQTR
jgi:AcrR family transcriptional regulator